MTKLTDAQRRRAIDLVTPELEKFSDALADLAARHADEFDLDEPMLELALTELARQGMSPVRDRIAGYAEAHDHTLSEISDTAQVGGSPNVRRRMPTSKIFASAYRTATATNRSLQVPSGEWSLTVHPLETDD